MSARDSALRHMIPVSSSEDLSSLRLSDSTSTRALHRTIPEREEGLPIAELRMKAGSGVLLALFDFRYNPADAR